MKHHQGIFLMLFLLTGILFGSCKPKAEEEPLSLDTVARDYVKLALTIGEYDPDFVDAYFGPEDWKPKPPADTTKTLPYEELKWQTMELLSVLEELDTDNYDSLEMLRFKYLHKQLLAVKTKLDMIAGELLPFDVESRALYDAVAPHFKKEHYDLLVSKLDHLLPGKGSLSERYDRFSSSFMIPEDKLDTVFKTAITEARKRTLSHITLPDKEDFTIEYVHNKPWSAYNWYKGNGQSLIQINTDLPIYIERAIDLACHEGYPGHHTYNASLEKNLVMDRGWKEFSIDVLFSPQSFIAEGTANYGIEVAFPKSERREFEKKVLFPLAGLDSGKVDLYYDVQEIRKQLSYAINEAAMQYLNHRITREEAAEWLVNYNLYSWDRAIQRISFIDKYRSYVINYNYGKDVVRNYIENQIPDNDSEKKWEIFSRLLSTPVTASLLE